MGGTFGPSGWITSGEADAFWYEITDPIPTGRIEYTLSGMSVGGSLSGYDHDILTFYQAPTGMAEPIKYMPGFRNNDFKAFTRIFGSMEPGRGGAMKLELAFCPRGEPWYHDTVCPAGCDGSGLAYARGKDKDVGWDPATQYRMIMAWEPGKISFSRDTEALGTVDFKGTYAAKPLRVRFGSPRHDGVYPGAAFMPKGLTFKDVKITGTAGAMTPICGSTVVPDAGPPLDTGVVPTDEVGVLQDVTAASWETGVYSVVTDLNPEGTASGGSNAVVYLKFPPISGVPKQVLMRLHTADFPSAAGGSGVVCSVADDAWNETTLTWATRPAIGTTCVGVAKKVDPDSEVEWDVTPLVTSALAGNRNFAIVSTDADAVHYLSKEADKSRGPRLRITAGSITPPSDGGTTDSGSDASAGDAGPIGSDTGLFADGGSKPGNDLDRGDVNGGCGCKTANFGSRPRAGLALVVAMAAIVSRRRKRP